MGRTPKPWYWDARRAYYATVRGRRHRLGTSLRASQAALRLLLARPEEHTRVDPQSLLSVLNAFVAWCRKNRAPKTHRHYKDFCQAFISFAGDISTGELTPDLVMSWLESQTTWNNSSKNSAITCLSRAMNWGKKNLGLKENPISSMDRFKVTTKPSVILPEEFRKILKHVKDPQFRELLIVSYDCGCRPQEVKQMEARHVDLEKKFWRFMQDESKTGTVRTVYIPTDRAFDIISRLVVEYPTGVLFRNTRGGPWTTHAVAHRFERLEKKVGKRFKQYDFRHTFITRKLLAGVDSHVVAKLSGHKDTSMLDQVYSHVADDHEFMLEQSKKDITKDKET